MGKASNVNIGRIKKFWNFFAEYHQKMPKTGFFAFRQITWDFDIETHIQGTTMRKLTSRRFRKCGSFWASEFLNGSYRCSKLTDCEILGPLPKIRGVTKKRHGHNNEFWALPSNQRGTNHVGPTLIPYQSRKLNIVAVSFFGNARFYWNFFSKFDPTLSAYNYASKTPNFKNYHIFGILRTSAFTWYPPILVIPFQKFE